MAEISVIGMALVAITLWLVHDNDYWAIWYCLFAAGYALVGVPLWLLSPQESDPWVIGAILTTPIFVAFGFAMAIAPFCLFGWVCLLIEDHIEDAYLSLCSMTRRLARRLASRIARW